MGASVVRLSLMALVAAPFLVPVAAAQDSHVCQAGDCMNGAGTSRYDGELGNFTYTGPFRNGLPHGLGRLVTDDGGIFEGTFENFSPVKGRAYETDGAVYSGQLSDWDYHGRGVMTYPDGAVYTGDWDYGDRDGNGSYTGAGGDVITGTWDNDRPVEGRAVYASGHIYIGTFGYDWSPDGEGQMSYPDGARYDGRWIDGRRAGQGRYVTADGEEIDGIWQADAPGVATLKRLDGSVYEGGFVDGAPHGDGQITLADGTVIKGGWANGSFVSGTLQRPGQAPVSGTFVDGNFVPDEVSELPEGAADPGSGWGQ